METIILGGGIAGLSLAHFLKTPATILEKQPNAGGLCRSFSVNGIICDIGPHIMFSKFEDILQLHTSLVPTNRLRRSNKIYHSGRFIKYPFENELSALSAADRDYCLATFLNNPYEDYEPTNMHQFFLKTFGEGITSLYLRPYNEKIWKMDPSYLDTQMVERIPKPPRQDIIASAHGKRTEGYKHQLYFHYPKKGGFQSLVNAYSNQIKGKAQLVTDAKIVKIARHQKKWRVTTNQGTFTAPRLVNCIPLPELFRYLNAPQKVARALKKLRYNSIHIVVVQARHDTLGKKFAVYLPDPSIIFHRVTKVNFLGPEYRLPNGGVTIMAEVTFRPGSELAQRSQASIIKQVVADLDQIGFVKKQDVLDTAIHTEKYEYVVYDLNHRQSVDTVLSFLRNRNIESVGRFAEFEYINSDQVVERARRLARQLNRVR